MALSESPSLATLRDIHLPDPIGWWPLAPGWYGLILFVVILLFLVIFLGYQAYQHRMPKRRALRLLAQYQKQYVLDNNASLACIRVSELLKRVALVYFPRSQVAGLQGEAWLCFLNQTGKKLDFFTVRGELLEVPYCSHTEITSLSTLFRLAADWIRQRTRYV